MTTGTFIKTYLEAAYPTLWVQTHEEDRVLSKLIEEVRNEYTCYTWDIVKGMIKIENEIIKDTKSPIRPLQTLSSLQKGTVLFLKDFHRFINDIEIVRTIKNLIPELKITDKHIIFISPIVNIPIELEKDITVLDFPLPTLGEIVEMAKNIVEGNDLKDIEIKEDDIEASKGLTLNEAENAIARSIIEEKKIDKRILEKEKLQVIRKTGLMEIQNAEPVENLGGLDNLKEYLQNRKKGFYSSEIPPYAKPHGIILVGPPGTGKSLSAKICASIFDIPLIRLDISSLKGSLVGESERNMNKVLQILRSIAPVVVCLDEFEKAFAGIASSAKTDGGTTLGMIGRLMTAMQDFRDEGVPIFWVATVNDIDALIENSQGAMMRRFDDIFFVDFPTLEEKKEIIKIMNKKYGVNIPLEFAEKMQGWTGAEIEKLAFSAIYDGLDKAFESIRPIYYQCKDSIERIREWAKYNARFANSEKKEENEKKERKLKIV